MAGHKCSVQCCSNVVPASQTVGQQKTALLPGLKCSVIIIMFLCCLFTICSNNTCFEANRHLHINPYTVDLVIFTRYLFSQIFFGQIRKFKNIAKIILIIMLLKKNENSRFLNLVKSFKIRNSRKFKHVEIIRSTVCYEFTYLSLDQLAGALAKYVI